MYTGSVFLIRVELWFINSAGHPAGVLRLSCFVAFLLMRNLSEK